MHITELNATEIIRPSVRKQAFQGSLNDIFNRNFRVIVAKETWEKDLAAKLRYMIYCVENPFENPADHPTRLERDVFDTRSINHILLLRNANGSEKPVGVVRVICPNEDVVGYLFPAQVAVKNPSEEQSLLKDSEALQYFCEISRIGLRNSFIKAADPQIRLLGRLAKLGLMRSAIESILKQDRNHALFAVEQSLQNGMKGSGIEIMQPLGDNFEYHGKRRLWIANIHKNFQHALDVRPEIAGFFSKGGELYYLSEKVVSESQWGTLPGAYPGMH